MAEAQRILVVEDDPVVAKVVSKLLKSEGYEPDAVGDGRSALDHVQKQQPDAIVLDVMLPDMSGFEVCQNLKLHRQTNLIPIVMLTALTDPASVRAGLRVGANKYLLKPVDADRLLRELKNVIQHREELLARRTHTLIELQMDSDRKPSEQLNDVLSELFLRTPLSDEQIEHVRYAVLEMIQNAAEWGNQRRKDLPVTIAYELTDDYVKFVITDQGPGFNPEKLPHAAHKEDPTAHMEIREKLGLRIGGFGILMTKGLVDELFYNDTGNQVTLIKYFKPREKNLTADERR